MPYTASLQKVHQLVAGGRLVGSGQCVALVHAAVSIPPTPVWQKGAQVAGNLHLVPGTIIATFDSNGRYGNHTNGTSHAAIYLRQTALGVVVIDQWKGHGNVHDHPPQQRIIYFHRAKDKKVNQGEKYYVVE